MLREFVTVYRLYRKGGHRPAYCLRTAYRIAIQGVPF
jgi:hypothetical protein